MHSKIQMLLLTALLHATLSTAPAAEFKSGNRVTIAATDTLRSDLYAAGQIISILGTAERDLIAAGQRIEIKGLIAENFYGAGQTIVIDGEVQGDILAFGADVELNGMAGSGIRAAAGSIFIKGTVNGDVVISGGKLTIAPEAVVNGDLIIAGGRIEVAGAIHGKLTGAADHAILAGTVDNDVELTIGKQLDLRSTARLAGNLTYRSAKQIPLENTEAVAGEIIFKPIEPEPGAVWFGWIARIWFWLATVIVGLVMIALGKPRVQNALDRTLQRPLPTLGFGAVALIATPIVVVFCLILLFTIPLGVILLVGYFLFAYLGIILLGTLLGREILRLVQDGPVSLYLAMFAGMALLYVLTLIPGVGGLIWFVELIGGLGIMTLGIYEALRGTPEPAAVQPQ